MKFANIHRRQRASPLANITNDAITIKYTLHKRWILKLTFDSSQEPSEALDLAARASVLRPNAFECAYAMSRAILALNKPSEALPHARRALLLAPQTDFSAVRTLKALQQEILTRINAGSHLNGETRSMRNYDSISLNLPWMQ